MRVLATSLITMMCTLCAPLTLAQQDPGHGGPTDQANNSYFPEPYYVATPDQLIRQGVDRLVGFMMGSPNADEQSVREFIGLEIPQYFDFEYMSRWAAGPLYHRLSSDHRAAMTAKLKVLFLNALAPLATAS